MTFKLKIILFYIILFLSCNANPKKLKIITNLPDSLKEASAIELINNSKLLWTIEDSGNKSNIYGLNRTGNIIKKIDIKNAKNKDWEDLSSDKEGNLYIGDFGNNEKKRKLFTIYKIDDLNTKKTKAKRIDFTLPKQIKSKDFEAFFLLNNHFYIFSKESKSCVLIKVPNKIGKHTAKLVSNFKLDGKNNEITGAAINNKKNTIVLLNHKKLWKLTNFKGDAFFKGDIEALKFDDNSQKEGICFKNSSTVYITDEKTNNRGGNLYEFKIN